MGESIGNQPLPISVIIPVHNAERFIEQSVLSALDQTCPPSEVICIDDASEDGSLSLLTRLQNEHPSKIRIIRLGKSIGAPGLARNVGIRSARGDWIAFLDADDFWLPEKLEFQWKCLRENEGSEFVHCAAWVQAGDSGARERRRPDAEYPMTGHGFRELFLLNPITTSSALVKKTKLLEAGLFRTKAGRAEDYFHWLKLAKNGMKFCYVDEPLCVYRKGIGFFTQDSSKSLQDLISIMESQFTLYPKAEKLIEEIAIAYRLLHLNTLLAIEYFRAGRAEESHRVVRDFVPPLRVYPELMRLRFRIRLARLKSEEETLRILKKAAKKYKRRCFEYLLLPEGKP